MSKIFELKDAPKQEEKTSAPIQETKVKLDPKMNYSQVDVLVQEKLKAIEEEKKAARKRRKQEKFLKEHPGIAQIKDKIGVKISLKSKKEAAEETKERQAKNNEEVKVVAEAPIQIKMEEEEVPKPKAKTPMFTNTIFEGVKTTAPTVRTGNTALKASSGGKWMNF